MAKTRTNQPVYLDKYEVNDIYAGLGEGTYIDVRIIDDFVFVNMKIAPLGALTPAETICTLPTPIRNTTITVMSQNASPSFGTIMISKNNGQVKPFGSPLPNAQMNVCFFYQKA